MVDRTERKRGKQILGKKKYEKCSFVFKTRSVDEKKEKENEVRVDESHRKENEERGGKEEEDLKATRKEERKQRKNKTDNRSEKTR